MRYSRFTFTRNAHNRNEVDKIYYISPYHFLLSNVQQILDIKKMLLNLYKKK